MTQIDTRRTTDADSAGDFLVQVTDGEPALVELIAVDGPTQYSVEPGVVRVPVQDVVSKVGFPNATGQLEWRRADGAGLVQQAAVGASGDYPDGGCPVELWLQHPVEAPIAAISDFHPDADLVEMETLSPLVTLRPGESTTLQITWSCL